MLKRLSVAIALVGYCTLVTAQSVSYTVLESNPNNYKRTALSLDLINCDTYLEPSAGYGAKLETVILDRIMPFIGFKYAWTDLATRRIYNSYPTALGGLKNQLSIDAGGVLFLTSKIKKKSVKIVLHSSSGGGYTFTKYIMVPSEVKRMFGVGGGIFFSRKALKIEDDAHPFFRYKSTNGAIDVPIENVGYTGTNTQPAGDAYTPYAMSYATSIYGGLHLRNVRNTSIRAQGYGKKSNNKVVDVYFDLMFAPVVSISNVKDIEGKEWKLVAQDGAIRRLGYKVGYAMHSTKTVGLMFYTEFGKRPGAILGKDFFNNGTYITVGLGVSIASGKQLGFKHPSKDKAESDDKK